jgi:hypothetical protein
VGRRGLEPRTSAVDRDQRCAARMAERNAVHRCGPGLSGVVNPLTRVCSFRTTCDLDLRRGSRSQA